MEIVSIVTGGVRLDFSTRKAAEVVDRIRNSSEDMVDITEFMPEKMSMGKDDQGRAKRMNLKAQFVFKSRISQIVVLEKSEIQMPNKNIQKQHIRLPN